MRHFTLRFLLVFISLSFAAHTFAAEGQFTLNLNVQGAGRVTLSPPGPHYAPGEVVELTAHSTPEMNTGTNTVALLPQAFAGWSGDTSDTWSQTIRVIMDRDVSVTATFLSVVRWIAPGGDSPAHSRYGVNLVGSADPKFFSYHQFGRTQHVETVSAPSTVAIDQGLSIAYLNDGATAKAMTVDAMQTDVLWSYPVPALEDARGLAPVVGLDRVYFPGDDGVYAFEKDGTFLWKAHQPGRMVMDSAERLWVQSGSTLALLARDGRVKLQWNDIPSEGWPAVGPDDSILTFQDSQWGPMIRLHDHFGQTTSSIYLPGRGHGAPLVDLNYNIFTPTEAGFVAYSRYRGHRWTYPAKAKFSTLGRGDGKLYIASERGLEAVNSHTGIPEWIIFLPGFLNYAPTLTSGLLTATRAFEQEGVIKEEVLAIDVPLQATDIPGWYSRHGNQANQGFTRSLSGPVPRLADMPVFSGYAGQRLEVELRLVNEASFNPEDVAIQVVSSPPGVSLTGKTLAFNVANSKIVLRTALLSNPDCFSITELDMEVSDLPSPPIPRLIQPIQVVVGDTVHVTNLFGLHFAVGASNIFSYTMLSPPDGAFVDGANSFFWTPSLEQAGAEYLIRIVATRDTVPPVSATNEFPVTVLFQDTTPPNMNVLILRVDFPDQPGHFLDREQAISLFMKNDGIAPYFRESSYGLINLNVTEATVPDVLRLPQEVASYRAGLGPRILADSAAAAALRGIHFRDYYRVVIVVPDIQLGMDWPSERWDQSVIFFNRYDFATVARQLARTYGFEAASVYVPTPDGAGMIVQDGDQYDLLGSGTNWNADLNPRMKHWAGWLPDTSVQPVSTSGVYRVYQFDDPNAPLGQTNKPLVLKLSKDDTMDYWVSFRDQADNATGKLQSLASTDGAYVLLGERAKPQTLLVDVSGGTAADPLLHVGRSYSDSAAGVQLRVLGAEGISPERYLEVEVTVGPEPPESPFLRVEHNAAASMLGLAWNMDPDAKLQTAPALDGPWVDYRLPAESSQTGRLELELNERQRFFRIQSGQD